MDEPIPPSDGRCSIEGCGSKAFCRGWCSKHYSRWQRHGDPLFVSRTPPSPADATDKFCPRCQKTKHVKYFAMRTTGTRKGYCRECEKAYYAEYLETPEGRKKRRRAAKDYNDRNRDERLRRTYGIGVAEYDALAEEQGHRCAICGTTERGQSHRYWSIDHCHKTGRIRGLLCHSCNLALGQFRDDPAILAAAIKYLE